jgi:hypothetical protein
MEKAQVTHDKHIPEQLGHLMLLNAEYGVLICKGNGCGG